MEVEYDIVMLSKWRHGELLLRGMKPPGLESTSDFRFAEEVRLNFSKEWDELSSGLEISGNSRTWEGKPPSILISRLLIWSSDICCALHPGTESSWQVFSQGPPTDSGKILSFVVVSGVTARPDSCWLAGHALYTGPGGRPALVSSKSLLECTFVTFSSCLQRRLSCATIEVSPDRLILSLSRSSSEESPESLNTHVRFFLPFSESGDWGWSWDRVCWGGRG